MTKIAILGFGTVGSGVAEVLATNAEAIDRRVKDELRLKYILDVRPCPDPRWADCFVNDFSVIEQDPEIHGLLILLNTMGGDVEVGLAIAEVIASMTKPTASVVLGGGHSIGVPLAVAAKRSFIVPSATMTIHPVRINGLVVGAPQTYTYFSQMQKRIINFICSHSKAREDEIHTLMMRPDMIATDVGSVIEGQEAVEYGLIDAVGGIDTALADLRKQIKGKKKKKPHHTDTH